MPVHNSDVAAILEQIADYLELKDENEFRIRSYRDAARTISTLSRNVAELVEEDEDLTELSGIGESIADKIEEIVETGGLEQLETLKEELPAELPELMEIEQVGPKRAKKLHDELGVETLDDLKEAAEEGEIEEVEGFGEKTQDKIAERVERATEEESRTRIDIAEELAETLVDYLEQVDGVDRVVAAGSYRRRKETVGDLDILVTCDDNEAVMDAFVDYDDVAEVISRGDTRSTVRLEQDFDVDLRVVGEESYGAALHYFTGSKEHNIACRQRGVDRGYKINEYGVFEDDERIGGETEEEIYELIEMQYVEPEMREDRGEVDAAANDELPELVTRDDIRGDLHCHTTHTDGRNELREMVEQARDLGYGYLAITDHSKAVTVAQGLDADGVRELCGEIDALADEYDDFTILKGIEVDIMEDGTLDLPDDVLSELDYVVGSVHRAFDLSNDEQTERIIKAMDNPCLNTIGHPTGRLINEREAYEVDVERLVEAAAERGCFLELNASPVRLDLRDIYCKLAKEQGVGIAIATDAHSTEELHDMKWGVAQARRGWLEAGDVINTLEIDELRKRLER